MSSARITVLVREDSVLGRHAFVSRSGEPRGWLEIGERGELALYGAPVARSPCATRPRPLRSGAGGPSSGATTGRRRRER